MNIINCINCGKTVTLEKIEKGVAVLCECGCYQMCLNVDESSSGWRVMNPFSFKDLRDKKNKKDKQ